MSDVKRDKLSWIEGDMPFSETFGDHFYARQDGRAETAHVFLGNNFLPERWSETDFFSIGELGFGTGLNLFETLRCWRAAGRRCALSFTSFEAFPMPGAAMETAIARWPDLMGDAQRFAPNMDTLGPGRNDFVIEDGFTLTLMIGEAQAGLRDWDGRAHAWYLDGFAPSKNPDMWSDVLMRCLAEKTAPDGTFATYTAAGWVRRNLQDAGFSVEKIKGHGTKREMMRGRLNASA